MILQYCKTQVMCLLVIAYVGVLYIKDGETLNRLTKKSH